MTFAYTARNPLGKMLEGTLDAATRDDAAQSLRREGLHVIKLEENQEEVAPLVKRRVKRSDIIYVTTQLAVMVDTGITLSAALQSISEEEQNPTLKTMLLDLKKSVEQGDDFSSALEKYPKYFDKTYIALVKSSEQTGKLGEMLDRIAGYQRKQLEMRGKVRAAMAYPAVMLLLAIGVTIFLLTFVLPKFEPLFSRKGAKLPTPTVVMMHVSNAMIHYWYLWLAGFVGMIAGFIFGGRTVHGRKAIDWLKINAPVLGPMFRKIIISRSIRTLGTMVQSGVSMIDALKMAAEVSGNYYYERLWLGVLEQVTSGEQIWRALKKENLFPKTLVQMVAAGEDTGRLDDVLDKVSNFYDHEVETAIKTATSLIEPLMITVMGVVVGGISMSLLLPIFSLSRNGGG